MELLAVLLSIIGFLIILALGMFKWYWNEKIKTENEREISRIIQRKEDIEYQEKINRILFGKIDKIKEGQNETEVIYAKINEKLKGIKELQAEQKKQIGTLICESKN